MFVVLRKVGGFYHVFDEDCYILNYLFNYKIVGNRVVDLGQVFRHIF